MSVLAVIPALRGVRHMRGRNTTSFDHGVSLTERALDVALRCTRIQQVVLVTNNVELQEAARRREAEVLARPEDQDADDTSVAELLCDVAVRYDQHETLLLLQPSTPFRVPEELDRIIAWYEQHQDALTGLVTVTRGTFKPNGYAYLLDRHRLLVEREVWIEGMGVWLMDPTSGIEVKSKADWVIAQAVNEGRMA